MSRPGVGRLASSLARSRCDQPVARKGSIVSRPSEPPVIGWIVPYTLTGTDTQVIRNRRVMDQRIWYGDVTANPGDTFPMIIVRVFDNGSVNGQVFLDGNDTHWVHAVTLGEGPGHFAWPSSS